jgi:hypothetical protein
MTCWRKIIHLCVLPFFMTSAESESADAQGKLDAEYTATLLSLPIRWLASALRELLQSGYEKSSLRARERRPV